MRDPVSRGKEVQRRWPQRPSLYQIVNGIRQFVNCQLKMEAGT